MTTAERQREFDVARDTAIGRDMGRECAGEPIPDDVLKRANAEAEKHCDDIELAEFMSEHHRSVSCRRGECHECCGGSEWCACSCHKAKT